MDAVMQFACSAPNERNTPWAAATPDGPGEVSQHLIAGAAHTSIYFILTFLWTLLLFSER